MRAVFALDHRFIPHHDQVLSEAQLPARALDRYLRVFDEIVVLSRSSPVPAHRRVEELVVSSRPGVSFRFVPNLASPLAQLTRRSRASAIVRQAIAEADVAIARMPSETGLLAAREAERLGKPWAAEVLGCPWDGLRHYGNLQGKLYAPVMALRMRRAVARAPFAIYVTQRFLQHRYPCRSGFTAGCSDVEIPPPSGEVLAARLARPPQAEARLVLGLIGTLMGRFKGIQTAFAALATVRHRLPPLELRILGAGDPEPWKEAARRHGVEDLVRFDGMLPPGAPVLSWLDEVDLYLQPSFKEGLPRALVEAMSRACPAVASTAAGIPELLEPGCLHAPGDVGALARLLVAAADPAWRRRQAERNWREAAAFSRDSLEQRRNAFWDAFAASALPRRPLEAALQ